MMSGNTYYVGGIEVARLSSDPLPDEVICSVFYQMAEFANDASVRQTLQIEMSQNGALELPPVSVSNSYEQERTRAATITGGPLQVRLPQATSGPDLALDTRDLSICTAILKRTDLIEDALLRASAQNGAKAGLERIAEVLAQNVTHYQALGAAEIVDEVFSKGDLAAGEDESLERKSFELALAIATEPSKLGQLRQMLVHLQVQRGIPEDFSTWALGQIDERVMSMALAYAHDAEVLVQILSFKGGTCDSLVHAIEDLYQQEQISQRVYVKAKLLFRAHEPPKPEKASREAQQQQADGSHSTASPGLEQALIEMLATVSIPIIMKVETDDNGQPFYIWHIGESTSRQPFGLYVGTNRQLIDALKLALEKLIKHVGQQP